jgi:hypothetical protein
MADITQAATPVLDTSKIGGQLSGLAAQASNVLYIVGIVVAFMVLIALFVGGIIILNRLVWSYKRKAYLNYEVGQTVQKKVDFFKVNPKTGYPEWRHDKKLIGDVPGDSYAFFDGKRNKSYEGFVRNGQIAWLDPKPMVGLIQEIREYIGDDGAKHYIKMDRPVHNVLPTDSRQIFANIEKKIYEAKMSVKWWQNPAVWGIASMGILLFGIFLLFLMNQSTAKLLQSVADKTFSFAQTSVGQVVK